MIGQAANVAREFNERFSNRGDLDRRGLPWCAALSVRQITGK